MLGIKETSLQEREINGSISVAAAKLEGQKEFLGAMSIKPYVLWLSGKSVIIQGSAIR